EYNFHLFGQKLENRGQPYNDKFKYRHGEKNTDYFNIRFHFNKSEYFLMSNETGMTIYIHSPHKRLNVRQTDNENRITLKNINKNANKLCKRRCDQEDCVQEMYKIIKESEGRNVYADKKDVFYFNFWINIPATEETIFVFVPKLELVEFLVYVGSTISLWFGT